MKPLSNASLEAKQCDGEEEGSLVLSLVSCYGRTGVDSARQAGSLNICGIGIIFLDFNHHLNCF